MADRVVRVLLVDDDQDDYVITRDLLSDIEGWTFDIEWAATFDEALKKISECAYDVHLFDYRLGKHNGLDLLRAAIANGCTAPIILMTGQGDRAVDLEAMAAGAADYLNKEQVDTHSLERCIRYAIERAQHLDALRASEERLRVYAAQLEDTNRELDAYGHTIAHDLNTPLSAVIGYSDLLITEFGDKIPQEAIDWIAQIQKYGQKMSDMIYQILWLAKMRNAAEAAVPVEVLPVIESTLQRFHEPLRAANIQVSIPAAVPPVMGHAAWIEEVLANLIGNAIKYMGADNPNPHIWIHGEADGEMVRLAVQDNGLGIPPDQQERLFEMFTRVHYNEAGGFGLGLSIVQRIVSKLNGQVGVTSTPGEGSTFWFTLPKVSEEVKIGNR